jgi:hypothetical protein
MVSYFYQEQGSWVWLPNVADPEDIEVYLEAVLVYSGVNLAVEDPDQLVNARRKGVRRDLIRHGQRYGRGHPRIGCSC